MAKKNELVRVLSAYLEEEGAATIKIVPGGRHDRLAFTLDGREQFFVLAGTPSDHRSVKNALSQLRRQIRERRERAME